MKRIFILFANVYGQMSGFVLTLVAALYLSGQPLGERVCNQLGLSLGLCRALVSMLLLVAFGVSSVLSVYRYWQNRKDDKSARD